MVFIRKWKLTVALIVVVLLTIVALTPSHRRSLPAAWSQYRSQAEFEDGSLGGVYNSTLGFQKIYAIGMKGRTDKSDALELAASITGIDITWSEGVPVADVSPKSYPESWEVPTGDGSALGAWRAHMNVLQKIIKDRVQTALVIEDDTDWDVTLKEQLSLYAEGVRKLQGSGDASSPYGTNWDAHWLGHCRAGPNGEPQPVYLIHDDTTVPPVSVRRALWRHGTVPDYIMSNDTRVVFNCHAGMCTFAYAVTFNGAQKILAALSTSPVYAPFDVAMSAICSQRHIRPFKCFSVYPPLMSSHRFAGSVSRDSDLINRVWNATHPEYTFDIVYSTMINTKPIITGVGWAASQWPKLTQYEARPLEASWLDEVRTEIRDMDWKKEEAIGIKGINQPR